MHFRPLVLALATALLAGCAGSPESAQAPAEAPVAQTPTADTNAAHSNAATPTVPDSMEIQRRLDSYAPVILTADLSHLSDAEKRMLALFIHAADEMDALFWQQAWGDRDSLLGKLGQTTPQAAFARINYGPWDRLGDNAPFVSGIGPTFTLAPAQTSPPRRMMRPALPLPPAGPAAMAEVSAPLKPSKTSAVASSNEASTRSGEATGTTSLMSSK